MRRLTAILLLVPSATAFANEKEDSGGWANILGLVAWLVVGIAFADFLLGEDGRKKLRAYLEDVWIRYDDLSWKHAGKEEASFCLGVLDALFGRRAFSMRRLLSCVGLMSFTYAALYAASEIVRAQRGYSFRWPNSEMHGQADLVGTFVFLYIGISLTQWICRESVKRLAGTRFESLKFCVALIVTVVASLATHVFVEDALKNIFSLSICRAANLFGLASQFEAVQSGCANLPSAGWWSFAWDQLRGGGSNAIFVLGSPLTLVRVPLRLFQELVVNSSADIYRVGTGLVVILLRVGIGIFFLIGWALRKPAHAFSTLVLYRLSQSDKGIIALAGLMIAGIMKLLE